MYGAGRPPGRVGLRRRVGLKGGLAVSVVFDETVRRQVESEVRTIKAEYSGVLPEESIDSAIGESLERLADSRVPQFVPLFVGRFTRERLKEILRNPPAQG